MSAVLHSPPSNTSSRNISGMEWSPDQYHPANSHMEDMYDMWTSPGGDATQQGTPLISAADRDPFMSSAASDMAASSAQQADYLSHRQPSDEEEQGQFTQIRPRDGPLSRLGGYGGAGDCMAAALDNHKYMSGTSGQVPRSRAPASMGAAPAPSNDHTTQQH